MYNTSRSLIRFIILEILTLGIYGLFVMSHITEEINAIASTRDGKHTMHYLLIKFVFSIISVFIVPMVWYHRLSNRIGDELASRNLDYKFGSRDYWIWGLLGSLIFVGPFIYKYKLFKAMNKLNTDYRTNTLGKA